MDEAYYRTRFRPDPGRRAVWRAIVWRLRAHLPADGTVADLGCGYADFINQVGARERLAVDANPAVAAHCEPGVRFHAAPLTDLGAIPAATVDCAFASNVLEHLTWPELEQAIGEIHRILRPGGRLILIQPNFRDSYRSYFDDYTHRTVFTHVSLADFCRAHGFAVVEVRARFLPLTMKSRLPKSYWLTRLYLSLPWSPLGGQMLGVFRKE